MAGRGKRGVRACSGPGRRGARPSLRLLPRTDVGLVGATQQLVKAVKVALVGVLPDAAALLQQVRVNGGTNDRAGVVKVNADELALGWGNVMRGGT